MKRLVLLLSVLMAGFTGNETGCFAQNTTDTNFRVLIPTGIEQKGFPLLKPLPPSDPGYAKSEKLFRKTFMSESVRLYGFVQQYLVNSGEKETVEPAYLLLSGHQGGFPVKGFYLSENGKATPKTSTWYIDLASLTRDAATVNSVTQIFPHEMGHVFFRLLSPMAFDKYEAYSADMHYFSMTTNYMTAFNEGYAEHFENASRIFEPDTMTKQGIERDAVRIANHLPGKIAGLDRDFRYPLRLGYYRAGLLLWYQRFEDYKRYKWAVGKGVHHLNMELGSGDAEEQILYRNTGLGLDDSQIRNAAQISSNEGVINAFFTAWMIHEKDSKYLEPSFYYPFLRRPEITSFNPSRSISPMENFYLKLFTVFHRQMNHNAGDTSFLQLFVIGWEREFPADKQNIKAIFHKISGHEFSEYPMPEIWLMIPGQSHSYMVMDQFGGNKSSSYSMNLNTAQLCDLRSIKDISPEEISSLINYRSTRNGLASIEEVRKVPGLSKGTVESIMHANAMIRKEGKDEGGGFSIVRIFTGNLGHIFLRGLIWFAAFLVLFYVFIHRGSYTFAQGIVISLKKFLKFLLFLAAGLAIFIFFPYPVLPAVVFIMVIVITDFLKSGNRKDQRREALMTSLFFGMMMFYSIF